MKTKIVISVIMAVLLALVAIVCDITVIVYQIVLSLEKFDAIFIGGRAVIPHWSLWLLFGNLFFVPAFVCFWRISK